MARKFDREFKLEAQTQQKRERPRMGPDSGVPLSTAIRVTCPPLFGGSLSSPSFSPVRHGRADSHRTTAE